jgi:SAM-dependent methyltransferase
MSGGDRDRWNRKWRERQETRPAHRLLRAYAPEMGGGVAVDLACGLGQNTLFLATRGYEVFGFDLSGVALELARRAAQVARLGRRAWFVQYDLDRWAAAPASVDVICVFRFLDRRLFPRIRAALRGGGWLFYETRHEGVLERLPDSNPSFLLAPGELLARFSDWHVARYEEDRENSALVARRPIVSRETEGSQNR